VNLILISMLALAAPEAPPTVAPEPTTHAELLDAYPRRLSDRDLAIGGGLFEASFNPSYQFNSSLGFGEVPTARYGLSSQWEIVMLGIRLIVAEDAQMIPGLAIRLQLHDLVYQHDSNNPLSYPVLRPGGFLELRDRFPAHFAANFSVGYVVSIQSDPGLETNERVSTQFFPINLGIEYSPLEALSFVARGSWIQDVGHDPFIPNSQTHWGLSGVAVWVPKSWLDLQAFFTANWYDQNGLGFVPELGIGATIRL
jgi:hypothetical protein